MNLITTTVPVEFVETEFDRAYDKIDHHLRNTLDDLDYAEFSEALELVCATSNVPDVLFDGFSVLQAMDNKAKARTSPENVSDVLDSVVRLIRSSQN